MSETDLRALCEEILRLDAEATAGPWASISFKRSSEVARGVESICEVAPYREALDLGFASDDEVLRGHATADLIARYRTLAPTLAREVLRGMATR